MNFNNILFLDIETVSQNAAYDELDNEWKDLWDHKTKYLIKNPETQTPETEYPRAAIYAEFGKIICISCGCLQGAGEEKKLGIKSYSGHDEKKLLKEFANMLQGWSGNADKFLCAHNGKEFDYPYLCRRMVVNGVEIPEALKISGRKPWEVRHLDTMEMWSSATSKAIPRLSCWPKCSACRRPKTTLTAAWCTRVLRAKRFGTHCGILPERRDHTGAGPASLSLRAAVKKKT